MKYSAKTLIVLVLVALLALLALANIAAAQDEGIPQCEIDDRRVNNRPHRDCGAPVLIYRQDNAFAILGAPIGINPPQPLMFIPIDDDIPVGSNVIIDQATNDFTGRDVVVSRLTTGEFQLNTFYANGAPYIVVWYRGAMDIYSLDPETGEPLDGATSIIVPGGSGAPDTSVVPAVGDDATGDEDSDTVVVTTPGTTIEVGDNCRVSVIRTVRLRSEPTTASAIVSRLPYNSMWQVTEYTTGWFRVIYEDTQGWVSADFVDPTVGCGLD